MTKSAGIPVAYVTSPNSKGLGAHNVCYHTICEHSPLLKIASQSLMGYFEVETFEELLQFFGLIGRLRHEGSKRKDLFNDDFTTAITGRESLKFYY